MSTDKILRYVYYGIIAVLAIVGLASESQHPNYLRRLQASDPEFLLTLNAERMVRLYDKWANGEEWRSVGEIDDLMATHSRQFRLSDLDWVSVARNGEGGVLAVITKKKRFSRRALVHDFGRGLLQQERVGEIAVHDGFVGAASARPLWPAIVLVVGRTQSWFAAVDAAARSSSGLARRVRAGGRARAGRDAGGALCECGRDGAGAGSADCGAGGGHDASRPEADERHAEAPAERAV